MSGLGGNLGSFKLSYVSPENDKIGKSGWWKLGRKSGVWRRKTGFENLLLDENECFEVDLQFGKVKKIKIIAKNGRKWPKTFFEKNLVEVGNLSNLATWIKNHCFYMVFYR